MSVLHALLLGLTQGIVVLTHSLVQIGHLQRERERGEEVMAVRQVKEAIYACEGSHLALDLYQSSASAMFLAAMPSYCTRMSLRAAVRSGLDMSIWICT